MAKRCRFTRMQRYDLRRAADELTEALDSKDCFDAFARVRQINMISEAGSRPRGCKLSKRDDRLYKVANILFVRKCLTGRRR